MPVMIRAEVSQRKMVTPRMNITVSSFVIEVLYLKTVMLFLLTQRNGFTTRTPSYN